ncbi:hypothetical protein ABK040_009308 [Willaertia magna]
MKKGSSILLLTHCSKKTNNIKLLIPTTITTSQIRNYWDHTIEFKSDVIYTKETGIDIMNNCLLNKGTAFSKTERDRLRIRGLLPSCVSTLEKQLTRLKERYDEIENDLDKYQFCSQLQDRNETLFYKFLTTYIKELAPIIYTPTVGLACQNFSHIFRRSRGMFFSVEDKGEMKNMVHNYPIDEIDVIVVTDGGRILGLGDLGANGDGIPIGKLALYVAAGGINPGRVLPIMLDVGTNNEKLLNDPLYLGVKQKRLTGDAYYEIVEEFVDAILDRWPNVLLQWEDFSGEKAEIVLNKYRNRILSFNDDIQGTGSVVVSGILNCLRATGQPFSDIKNQTFVVAGSGAAGLGVVSSLKEAMKREGLSDEEACSRFYIVDKDGMMTKRRLAMDCELSSAQKYYAESRCDVEEGLPLIEVVKKVKPDILLGLSGVGSLSLQMRLLRHNPTSKSEATAEQVFRVTGGDAIFASGSPFAPVTLQDGSVINTSQANNMFCYPGLGLGTILTGCKKITDEMFYAASKALAATVSEEALKKKEIYPHVENIRDVSMRVAIGVMRQAHAEGNAKKLKGLSKDFIENDGEMEKYVRSRMYEPKYVPIVNK